MPASLLQYFILHPVGQGFFYSGKVTVSLSNQTENFRFVMDCGSLNKKNIKEEAILYRDSMTENKDTIDLLIISHFDADHVNSIGSLLKDKKVKKIVAPFLNFTERLFLVLRAIEQKTINRNDTDDAFAISAVIDPPATLASFLDDDGLFILIRNDPNKPIFPLNDGEAQFEEGSGDNLAFNIYPLNNLTLEQSYSFQSRNLSKVKIVKDSQKGYLSTRKLQVMEFLFYKKSIGHQQDLFFKKVYDLFIKKFEDRFANPLSPTTEEITKVVQSIVSAAQIKRIFSAAIEAIEDISLSGSQVINMNTTALCLLHHNLLNIQKPTENQKEATRIPPHLNLTLIKKLDGTNESRIEQSVDNLLIFYSYFWGYNDNFSFFRIPNVLLTSDSFLLERQDVLDFYNKYKHYWDKFWLFQMPHHGSRYNADYELLNKLPSNAPVFINYGIKKEWGGSWRHPSPILINSLVITGHSKHILPVNEVSGIRFRFEQHY